MERLRILHLRSHDSGLDNKIGLYFQFLEGLADEVEIALGIMKNI